MVVICLPVYITHTMNGIECQDNFSTVESGRIFTDFITCEQRDEVTARHVVHNHVQLERQAQRPWNFQNERQEGRARDRLLFRLAMSAL
jgi:hypothetical protein